MGLRSRLMRLTGTLFTPYPLKIRKIYGLIMLKIDEAAKAS